MVLCEVVTSQEGEGGFARRTRVWLSAYLVCFYDNMRPDKAMLGWGGTNGRDCWGHYNGLEGDLERIMCPFWATVGWVIVVTGSLVAGGHGKIWEADGYNQVDGSSKTGEGV